MTKQNWLLVLLLVVLGGCYAFFFTDWIGVPQIQINASTRPVPSGNDPDAALPIVFGLDRDYELTSVKVFAIGELATNKVPLPMWQLVAKSNSVPTRGFGYGTGIGGMTLVQLLPAPKPLVPGVPYRLEVVAGRARGQVDFTPQAMGEPAN